MAKENSHTKKDLGGRPTKYTPETIAACKRAVSETGLVNEIWARKIIDRTTYDRWKRQHKEFYPEIKSAIAEFLESKGTTEYRAKCRRYREKSIDNGYTLETWEQKKVRKIRVPVLKKDGSQVIVDGEPKYKIIRVEDEVIENEGRKAIPTRMLDFFDPPALQINEAIKVIRDFGLEVIVADREILERTMKLVDDREELEKTLGLPPAEKEATTVEAESC